MGKTSESANTIRRRRLSAEYGVSDVTLGKVCRKLQIPLPGPGHWTKIECGHTIPRPPLPEVKDLLFCCVKSVNKKRRYCPRTYQS